MSRRLKKIDIAKSSTPIEAAQKPKRIRKKPLFLNPTYASLKTRSQQKNPIVFAAFGTNVFVMRKLIFTEEMTLPEIITIDIVEAEAIYRKLSSYGGRSDERAQEANLSQTDMQDWREKYNVYESASIYAMINQNERDIATLYHVFKLWPGRFVPNAIATTTLDTATSFWHKQRAREEPIHCRVVFTGALPISSPLVVSDNTCYIRTSPPYMSAQQFLDAQKDIAPYVPFFSSDIDFRSRKRVFVAIKNKVFFIPLLILSENETNIPKKITVDLNEVRQIIDIIRPMGLFIDERARKAVLTRDHFDEWMQDRNICEETSIFTALTEYSRDLLSIYWLFMKSPLYKGIRPFPLAHIEPGQTTFEFPPSMRVTNIICTIEFVGNDPYEHDNFNDYTHDLNDIL